MELLHHAAASADAAAAAAAAGHQRPDFSPYEWNGGSVIGVAGKDFVVLAADRRLAAGYSIKTRSISRIHQLASHTLVGCGGCHADVENLFNTLTLRATMFKHNHGVEMSTVAAAQLLSNTLYYRRFFPIYALAVVAGLDDKGEGYVAGYDAVGSYIRSREGYQANGSAASLLMPMLDNVFGTGTAGYSSGPRPPQPYTAEQVVEIIKSVFISGGERDIMLGDSIDIYVVTKAGGVQHSTFDLKLD